MRAFTCDDNEQIETISGEKIQQYEQRLASAQSLDQLLELLDNYRDYVTRLEKAYVDHTCLPIFGGVEVRDTAGIWSWDETRLLRCDNSGEFYIVDR